ncbi:MAG: hypothetical protein LUC83_10660 [Clostridiales bacterium]|nr:hypothetical protein [Clostridiales bacterium]
METLFHLAGMLYTQYQDELALLLLVCIFLLMIFLLAALRRCRKQIKLLTEKTREMTRAALSQRSRNIQRGQEDTAAHGTANTAEGGCSAASRRDEEVFGSVIQEIFP